MSGWVDEELERVIRAEELAAVPGQVECPVVHGVERDGEIVEYGLVRGGCPECGAAV